MSASGSRTSTPNWRNLTILIVDQDSAFRFWARSVFRKLGVREVFSTASGTEALEIMKAERISICLADLVMDDIPGADFVRVVRDRSPGKQADLPIVLLSRADDIEQLAPAFEAGVENIIQKPVSESTLVQRVGATAARPQRIAWKGTTTRANRRTDRTGDYEGPERRAGPADRAETFREVVTEPRSTSRAAARGGGKAAPGKPARGGTLADFADDDLPAASRPRAGGTLADFDDDPPTASRPRSGGTLADFADDPARSGGGGDDDWHDAVVSGPGKAKPGRDADWSAELDATSQKRGAGRSDDDWNDASDQPKGETRTGEDVDELDLPGILDDHRRWLESRAAEGARANLEKLDIAGVDLSGLDLSNANLRAADMSDAVCRGTVLQGADLRGAVMSGAVLREADLTVAKLRHDDMRFADLTAAVFKDADLAGARMSGVKIEGTDFTGAIMLYTDLEGADLEKATGLTQQQIAKAVGDTSTKLPPRLRLSRRDEE
jgi:uncharacterized protein YjbI with pentapeptide repeats/CheY-like chemotaxis protein